MNAHHMREKLLKDRSVVEEIQRHQWLESEKAGYDIGFERAAEDWLERFSKAWMAYHMPKQKNGAKAKVKPKNAAKSSH